MGTDITSTFEKKIKGKWVDITASETPWQLNPYHNEHCNTPELYYSERHSALYQLLNNAGRGNDDIVPMIPDRGLPADASKSSISELEDEWGKGYYTLREFLEYDWGQPLTEEATFLFEDAIDYFKPNVMSIAEYKKQKHSAKLSKALRLDPRVYTNQPLILTFTKRGIPWYTKDVQMWPHMPNSFLCSLTDLEPNKVLSVAEMQELIKQYWALPEDQRSVFFEAHKHLRCSMNIPINYITAVWSFLRYGVAAMLAASEDGVGDDVRFLYGFG